MNREEKKKFLKRYVELKRKVESLKEEAFFWNDRAVSVPIARIDPTGVKGSKGVNPVEEHLEVLDLLEEKEREAVKILDEILKAINTVDIPEYRSVLTYRYVNDLYFHQIAVKMNYSMNHVYKVHRKALDVLKVDSK